MLGITATLFIIAYIIWNFPWLTKYYTLKVYREKIASNKIIVFSDVHIKKGALPASLEEFIVRHNFDTIIVAGDLLEYGHKRIHKDELERVLKEIFNPVIENGYVKQIFYVTSTSTHDPKVEDIIELPISNVKIVVVPGLLILENKTKYFITHGDYVSRNGAIARVLNKISRLWLERKLRGILDVPRDAWLICGHTHIPSIDRELRIANTGGWKGKLWIKPTYTVVTIDNRIGEVSLEEIVLDKQ